MSTVRFWRDEVYPIYGLEPDPRYGHPLEVDDATIQRWQRVEQEYAQMQLEIAELAKQNPAYYNGTHWLI